MGELNHSAFKAVQKQNSRNGANSNYEVESEDAINTAVLDRVNTRVINKPDVIKKPDSRIKIIV